MQPQPITFTFEDNDKFILSDSEKRFEIPLDSFFKLILKKNPGSKGPIDSIKALLNNEKPDLKPY